MAIESTNKKSEKKGIAQTVRLDSSMEAISERGRKRNLQLEAFFRGKMRESHNDFLASIDLDTSSLTKYEESSTKLRARLLDSMGGWPPRPKEVKTEVEELGEMEPGRLYRVHVQVMDEIEMPALFLVPYDAEKNPKPAVICQHGYGGSPEWAMGFGTGGVQNYMNSAGHRLASAGYVVIAPQIVCSPPGGGEDRNWLDRLARLSGRSLLAFEMFELSRVVDWLQTRPEVIHDRIGMYGISQGGKSTLFFTALETRLKAAVCSCYFNNRWNKMLEEEHLKDLSEQENLTYGSYLAGGEDDKFNIYSAPLWEDHILGALICPRPFMVEIGRYDSVIYWQDAVEEYKKLKGIYEKMGMGERVGALVSNWGGHEMFFDDAKNFLDRWLVEEA